MSAMPLMIAQAAKTYRIGEAVAPGHASITMPKITASTPTATDQPRLSVTAHDAGDGQEQAVDDGEDPQQPG